MEPEHLSWSQVNMLQRCGEQYRMRYVEGISLPPGMSLIRGKATHRSQEANLRNKLEHGELLPVKLVQEIAADSVKAQTQDEPWVIDPDCEGMSIPEAVGFCTDEAVALAGLHASKVAPKIEPSAIEVRIEMQPSEALPVKFVSVLDLVHMDVTVIDTKTARKSPSDDDVWTSDQLTSQALAFNTRYGKPPGAVALDVLVRTPKKGEVKHVPLRATRTVEDMSVFIHRANAALRMIQAEIFLPASQDHWACSRKWCGYADRCPYFRGRPRPKS